jgi:hypothetical protein
MLPHRFQQLTRVQFSTAFACCSSWRLWDLPPGLPADFWELPDDLRLWEEACRVLASFDRLGYLCVAIENYSDRVDPELLLEILLPLKGVSARDFAVRIPGGFVDSVREKLGEVPFRLIKCL